MSDLLTLANWMTGDFSNWEQAIANPPFYSHIRVCIRPLPVQFSDEGIWLYSEQAYDYEINRPYRTAVLHLITSDDPAYPIYIENYRIKNASDYFGASREPDRLRALQLDNIEKLSGCKMLVHRVGNSFKGAVEPGKSCTVVRNGKSTYLSSEFEISENSFSSLDRGYDPVTNELVWGSIAGAFDFAKKTSFA